MLLRVNDVMCWIFYSGDDGTLFLHGKVTILLHVVRIVEILLALLLASLMHEHDRDVMM